MSICVDVSELDICRPREQQRSNGRKVCDYEQHSEPSSLPEYPLSFVVSVDDLVYS